MNSSKQAVWQSAYDIEIPVSPEVIWRFFSDVPGWRLWNAGIERIEIDGPFAAGTEFRMTPPGQDTLTSRLIDVRPNEMFVDETRVGDLVIKVSHRIESLRKGWVRVVYAVEAEGPGCAEIGPVVSADFPEVLKSLSAIALSGS